MFLDELKGVARAEINELFLLGSKGLLPMTIFSTELARVIDKVKNGTCNQIDSWYSRKHRTVNGTVRVRAPIGSRPPIHCRNRLDNNLNIVLRRLGVEWQRMKPLNSKTKLKMVQQKMVEHGLCGTEFKALLDFEVDETANRQEYSATVKAILRSIAEEKREVFAQRVATAKAASALLVL